MNLSHDEMIERRCPISEESIKAKAIDQAKIDADKEAFFANGGKITVCGSGVMTPDIDGQEWLATQWTCSKKADQYRRGGA